MDYKKIIAKLEQKYPGKKIIKLPEDNPAEILVEIESTEEHPEYSVAIAVIDRSVPHYHKKMVEEYEILSGELSVFVDGVEHKMTGGEKIEIPVGAKHYAVGDETWIKCTARPGWTVEDHIMEDTGKVRVDEN